MIALRPTTARSQTASGISAASPYNPHVRKPQPPPWFRTSARSSGVVDTNLPPALRSAAPYRSSSNFLRSMTFDPLGGLEFDEGPRRSRSMQNVTVDIDDLKEELMNLKKSLAYITHENTLLKAQAQKLQTQNARKTKQLEEFLGSSTAANGTLQTGRSALTARHSLHSSLSGRQMTARQLAAGNATAGIGKDALTVNSLKQKCLRFERTVKDKDAFITKLKSELKLTNLNEMRTQMETMYQEVLRLQHQLNAGASSDLELSNAPKDIATRMKSLTETVVRLNAANEKLQMENKQLLKAKSLTGISKSNAASANDGEGGELLEKVRRQLARVEDEKERYKEKLEAKQKEVADLKSTIKALEQEMKSREGKGASLNSSGNSDSALLRKKTKQQPLHPTPPPRRPPSAASVLSEKRPQPELSHRSDATPRRPSSRAKASSPVLPKKSSPRLQRHDEKSDEDERQRLNDAHRMRDTKLEQIRRKHAAKRIQRGWRDHRQHQRELEEFYTSTNKSGVHSPVSDGSEILPNRASPVGKQLTSGFRDDSSNDAATDEGKPGPHEASEVIGAAGRAHLTRQHFLQSRASNAMPDSDDDSEHEKTRNNANDDDERSHDSGIDEAATIIQAAARGHLARKTYLASTANKHSDDESEDDDGRDDVSSISRAASDTAAGAPQRRPVKAN